MNSALCNVAILYTDASSDQQQQIEEEEVEEELIAHEERETLPKPPSKK